MRIVFFLLPLGLVANPQNLSVHEGQAQATQQGNLLEVVASDRAILNWNSFSIGAGETTRFIQPSSNAAVLNRVTGSSMSEILGALEANGKVYLMNPNGIVIGPEGQINAAAFLASTADMKLDDFVNQKELHLFEDSQGSIMNLGTIQTSSGPVILFAHRIENLGVIESAESTVSLAAGREVLLDPTGDSLIFIRHQLDGGGIDNQGTIRALEARLEADGPFGLAISCGGEIEATSIVREGGHIFLRADEASVEISSRLTAPEGSIEVVGGEVLIADSHFDVSGEQGGFISILGSEVEIKASEIHADGTSQGGKIRIGGDFQGKDREILNAQNTMIHSDVSIFADSASGEGGKVIVWSDGLTEFHGSLSAQGHTQGGFVEVSGAQSLWMTGAADLRSKIGSAGTLLLDPGSVSITVGAGTGPDTFGDAYIQAQLELGNLTIDTANATAGPLTITIDASVTISPVAGTNKLTLIAGDSITFSGAVGAPVTISNTPLDMQAVTFIDLGMQSVFNFGSSAVPSTWTAGTSIYVNTAGIGDYYTTISWAGNSTFTMDAQEQILLTATLFTQTTTITSSYASGQFNAVDFTAHGAVAGTYIGISLENTSITAVDGNISLTGTGGDTGSGCKGIYLTRCPSISTTGLGNVAISGTGVGGAAADNSGVHISTYLTFVTASNGTIQITGNTNQSSGTSNNYGIFIDNSYVHAFNGAVTCIGTGGGASGSGNDGIYVFCDGTISGSGSIISGAAITLTGSNSLGTGNGINIGGGTVTSSNGDVHLNGSGSGGNYGILVENMNSLVQTTGTGSLFLDSLANGMLIGYLTADTGSAIVEATGTGAISATSVSNITINGGLTQDTFVRITNALSTQAVGFTADRTIQIAQAGTGASTVSNSGSGNITLLATGTVVDSYNGIELFGGALTVNSGTLSITSNALPGSGFYGVYDTGTTLNPSGTGSISITGTGGTGGFSDTGIYLLNAPAITTTSGTITMNGTGGGSSSTQIGLLIDNTHITAGANITLTGTTVQSSFYSPGIQIQNGAQITCTGTGNLHLTGYSPTTGPGSGINFYGGTASCVDGNLTLTGSERSYSSQNGVLIDSGNTNLLETTGGGNILFESPDSDVYVGFFTVDNGTTTVQATGSGIIQFTADNLITVNQNGSAVNVTTASGNIEFTAGTQNVVTNATVTAGASGAINVTSNGTGFSDVTSAINFSGATVNSLDGTITLTATGTNSSGQTGISLSNTAITSSSSGSIILNGTGRTLFGTPGYNGVSISGGSLTASGNTISITGTGGGDGTGIIVAGAATVSTGSMLTFNGFGNGSGSGNDGISCSGLCDITATTSIEFNGTASASAGSQIGILIEDATVHSTDAPITFTGSSSGTNAVIIGTFGSTVQTTGSGNISINSTAGDILIGYSATDSGAAIVEATGTGAISATSAANININGGPTQNALIRITNALSIQPITLTADRTIQIAQAGAGASTVSNSGSGDITLLATGTLPGSYNGIELFGGALTANTGTLSITSNALPGAGFYGVYDTGTTLNPSGTGSISITGTGGNNGANDVGIYLLNAPAITTTSGTITMDGTGGGSGSTAQVGLLIDNTQITANANITLTGTAVNASFNSPGIKIQNGTQITCTGTGNLHLTGYSPISGPGAGINFYGGTASCIDGNLTLTGSERSYSFENGVLIDPGSTNLLETTGAGNILLESPDSDVYVGTFTIDNGTTTIRATGSGIIQFTANNLIAVNQTGNAVSVTTASGNIEFTAGAQSSVSNATVTAGGSGAINVTSNGTGFSDVTSAINFSGATVSSVNGTITLTATGTSSSGQTGISLSSSAITSSGNGAITLNGTGRTLFGTPGYNGVSINGGSLTTSSGAISITGTGGGDGTGIIVAGATTVNAANTLTLNGFGNGSGSGNDGISCSGLCDITATTSIAFNGTASSSSGSQIGILIQDATVHSTNAPITFTGSSPSTNAVIIETFGSTVQTTGSGNLSINSTAGDILIGYNGTDGGSAIVQTTGTGALSFSSSGNINIAGGTVSGASVQITNVASISTLTLIAGNSLNLTTAGTGVPTISNGGTANSVLVVDNNNPSSPSIGTSGINLSANAVLVSTGAASFVNAGAELRLYTASPAYNTFNAPINGVTFVSTDPQQVYGTYYPSGSYIGPGYTLYYKSSQSPPSPPAPPPTPVPVAVQTTVVATNETVLNPAPIQQVSLTYVQPSVSTPSPATTCRTPSVSIQAQ